MDFSSLINDPQAMYGMALLGAARSSTSPFADAQKQVYAMQKQAADIQLMQAQQQRMSQMTTNERQQQMIALQNFMLQRGITNRAANLTALGGPGLPANQLPPPEAGLPQGLLDLLPKPADTTGLTNQYQQGVSPNPMFPPSNMSGPGPAPEGTPAGFYPPGAPQAPAGMPDMGPVDQFGTPLSILKNLAHTESNNNPHAVGPLINDKIGGRAIGLMQFRPSTVDMLKKQGIADINPWDATSSTNGASQYLQSLLKQNGGNWYKTIAQYGGRNGDINSPYVQNIMAGTTPTMQGTPPPVGFTPPSATGAAPQPGSLPNTGTPLIQAGGMMGLVNPAAGNVLVEAGKALAPVAVPPNTTRVNPLTGQTSVTPPTAKEQQETKNITVDAQGFTAAGREKAIADRLNHAEAALKEDHTIFRDAPQVLDAIGQARAALKLSNPMYMGPGAERKVAIAKFLNNTFPGLLNITPEALTNSDIFKSQVVQPLLNSVKPTGGRMSTVEIAKMTANFGSLETDPKAMANILDIIEGRYKNEIKQFNDSAAQFNKMAGTLPHRDYTIVPNGPATVGPAANTANLGASAPTIGGQTAASTPVGGVYKGMVKLSPNWQDQKSWAKAPGK